jgi:hypothetical protein
VAERSSKKELKKQKKAPSKMGNGAGFTFHDGSFEVDRALLIVAVFIEGA